jgi:AmiR/NasT family two-component response regulator
MPDGELDGSATAEPAESSRALDGEVAQLRNEVAGLLKAVESRDVIGQAKGILMERQKLNADQAFDALRLASQRSNTKVVDIARLLAETGEWPVAEIGEVDG